MLLAKIACFWICSGWTIVQSGVIGINESSYELGILTDDYASVVHGAS
jgi:hypothetical protein